jgi:two-component system LytT family sensor kinase
MTRNKIYWIIQFSSWGFYIIYIALRIPYLKADMPSLVLALLFNFILFIFTTHIYRQLVRKRNIEGMKLHQFLFFPVLANFIIALLVQIVNSDVLHFDQMFWKGYEHTPQSYIIQSLDTFRFAMPWFIFYHGIKFAEKAIQNERDKLEAQMQLKIAELENLKNQLNPHFLFNSLNSIRSLTISDPKLAREAITKLSDLLRISLTYKGLQDILFEEELDLVKDYLSLEKIRYEDRLNYHFEISKKILNALIPPMALQLLVENAVKHGIAKEKKGGEILIFAHSEEGNLIFGVKNTGNLIKANADNSKRLGIGLANLKRRLELNYGVMDGFKISELNKVVTSEVCIPMKVK